MEEEKKEVHHGHHKTEHGKKTLDKLNSDNLFVILAVVLLIILLVNLYITFNLNSDIQKNSDEMKEKLRPARIQLAVIKNSKCTDCYDIAPLIDYVNAQKVNVTQEKTVEFDSAEGKQLAVKYSIDKVPSFIITGEIDKAGIEGLEKTDDALVLRNLNPPYTNATNGNIVGRVALYKIYDPKCDKCNDMGFWINQFIFSGIKIVNQVNLSVESAQGKDMVKKYKLDFAPALVLSKDAGAYGVVQQAWSQIGTKASDGSYVLTLVNPPFINLTTGEVRGIVDITYLTDDECTECYNINQHKSILTNPSRFGIFLDKEEKIDISEPKGKELLLRYNITQVPTIILFGGVKDYPSSSGLTEFFSVEKDGSYVFRKLSEVGGAYMDLAANTVVRPRQAGRE